MGGNSQFPFLDPNRQRQFVSQFPSQIPMQPDQAAPTTAGREMDFSSSGAMDIGSTPGSIEDLEGRATARDINPQLVQQQQQENSSLQDELGKAQQQLDDPLNTVASGLADQYKKLQSERAQGIKGFLKNFLLGMGTTMMHQGGILTPEEKQINIAQQIMHIRGAQSLDQFRQMQAENLKLVTRTMPDGSTIQIPQGHVAAFDASMARGQLKEDQPKLDDLIGRAVFNARQQGRDPNTDPVVKQLLQVRQGMQKPTMDSSASQKEEFMSNIQPAIMAKEITPDMLTDVRRLVTGIQNSRAIPAGQKPALVSYLIANNTPASAGTQAQVKVSLADQNKKVAVLDSKQGNNLTYLSPEEINARNSVEPGRFIQAGLVTKAGAGTQVIGFNPTTGQRELRPSTESATLEGAMPVTLTQIEKYNDTQRQFNDVQMNVSRYVSATNAYAKLPTSTRLHDETMINAILNKAGVFDLKLQIGEGGKIVVPGLSAALEAASREASNAAYQGMSPQAKDLMNGYLRSMAAVPAYVKALTNVGRTNKEIMDLELANIPNPAMSPSDILRKMQAFQENIDMATEGLPKIPGLQSAREVRQKFEGTAPVNQIPANLQQYMGSFNQFNFNPISKTISPR